MPIVDTTKVTNIDTSYDGVVIQHFIEDIPGGRSLDVTGVPAEDEVIKAGHVIIRETGTEEYKALGYTAGGAYAALPSGHEYAGILYVSVPKNRPFASIMVRGTVNTAAASNAGLPDYPSAVGDVLSLIRFV